MDNHLANLMAVEHINLSFNTINNIQKWSFTDLKMLQILDLSYNRIYDDDFFTDLGALTALNVSYNQFDAFDPSNLQTINEVNFQGNPLGCSWLLSEMVNGEFGTIRLGKFLSDAKTNRSDIKLRAPEEIRCLDYDSDNPLRVQSVERNIVVVRQVIKEPCAERKSSEINEVFSLRQKCSNGKTLVVWFFFHCRKKLCYRIPEILQKCSQMSLHTKHV